MAKDVQWAEAVMGQAVSSGYVAGSIRAAKPNAAKNER
jgi:hypothetical protein